MMRVVYLTAGAAGMYCGSCMRDNTLVAALRADGRDVLLLPLYTPIRTDELDVSEPHVFYGGINVYLQQRSAVFRHTPWWVDRIFDSPILLQRLVRGSGNISLEALGQLTLSILEGEQGEQRKELHKLLAYLEQLRPDLINLPNAMFVHMARPIHDRLKVPVLCTLTGEDIYLDRLSEPHRGAVEDLIRLKGRDVDGYVAVSEYYAACCRRRFDIPDDRMHVVPLGVRLDNQRGHPRLSDTPFTIGYLARICPEKGLHVLCDALHILHVDGRDVRVLAAGDLGPDDRPYFDEVRETIVRRDLGDRFDYLGQVDRQQKLSMLRSAHVLSVPTVYREAKGLFVLEALGQGVPVVLPRHGAFPELIQATGGGLLVEPENPQALADGIAQLMDDPTLRHRLACQGRAAVAQSFTDRMMAERTWTLYRRYVENREFQAGV